MTTLLFLCEVSKLTGAEEVARNEHALRSLQPYCRIDAITCIKHKYSISNAVEMAQKAFYASTISVVESDRFLGELIYPGRNPIGGEYPERISEFLKSMEQTTGYQVFVAENRLREATAKFFMSYSKIERLWLRVTNPTLYKIK